jgi:DNA polymerase-3 subunit delta'
MRFADVVGHKELKDHLANEVNNDKVSHAQLFLGKAGYGGLPLALGFTQYLFCENRSNNDSCGTCPSCSKIQGLQHPDVHFAFPSVQSVSKTSDPLFNDWREQLEEQPYFNLSDWVKRIDSRERKPIISTQESEEIIKKLSLRSFEGGYKVMIIWMAEEMNPSCANKLLKIIEEPPARTLFLLVAESQEKMLQTILSRTQIVKVPRISIDDLSNYLIQKQNTNTESGESVASRSDGDLLEALEAIGDHVEQGLHREQFIKLMRVCYSKKVLDMMAWSEELGGESKGQQQAFLKYALHMFRQSMLRNYTEDHLTRVSTEENAFLEKFSRFITGNNVFDLMETFNNAHYHIERNANAKILFMNLCFQVMRFIHAA